MVAVAAAEGLLYIDDEFVGLLLRCYFFELVADAVAADVMQPKRTQWMKPMMMHETPMTSQSGSSHVWGLQQQLVQHQLVAAYSDFEPPASFADVAAPSLAATSVPCCSSHRHHCHRYPLLLDSCYVSLREYDIKSPT